MNPRLHHLDDARARFGARFDAHAEALDRADPLADALLHRFRSDPAERGRLREALHRGIGAVPGASPELRALFAAIDVVPPWVDRARLARGARVFHRAGVLGGIALGARSLVGGYASPVGNKPLVLSGRLEHDVPARLAETGAYVAATHAPGGLDRFGAGFAANVGVRLIHAHARAMAAADPRWDPAWGVPINQHDLAATTLLFSTVWVDGARALGVEISREDAEDHLHLWRYASVILGVEPALVPETEAEANDLCTWFDLTEGPPDEDARRLVRALLDPPEGPARQLRRQLAEGLVRGVLGPSRAQALGVAAGPFAAVVPAVRAFAGPVSRLTRQSRWLDPWMVRGGRRYWAWASTPGTSSPAAAGYR